MVFEYEGSTKSATSRSREKAVDYVADARAIRDRRTERTPEVSTEKFAKIKSNTVYKIITDQSLTLEEKKDLLIKSATVDPERMEESRARLDEWALFKEYMQSQRIQLNKEILATAETESFANLQGVIEELNNAMIDFEDKMKPLTEILDAVYELRKAGKTLEMVREIGDDKEWEAGLKKEIDAVIADTTKTQTDIEDYQRAIAAEKDRKKFIFFGGPKNPAEIERLEGRVAESQSTIAQLGAKASDLNLVLQNGPGTQHPELARQKAALKDMLNLSGDAHRARHKALIEAARNFVVFSESRTEKALKDFEVMRDQIKASANTTASMHGIYTLMDEAASKAESNNQAVRDQFTRAAEGETAMQKLERENRLGLINEFVTASVDTKLDTTKSLQELSQERARVDMMSEQNRQNITNARSLKSSGVAAVAGQLTMTVNTLGSAALYHSQESAKETMRRMGSFTQDIMMKESINVAAKVEDVNNELLGALDNIAALREVTQEAMTISREGTREMLRNLEETAKVSKEFEDVLDEKSGTVADVQREHLSNDNSDKRKGSTGGASGGAGLGNLFASGPKV